MRFHFQLTFIQAALCLLISAIAVADTGPYYAGDPFGGGPDFTCDDSPCDSSCSGDEGGVGSLEEPPAIEDLLTGMSGSPEIRRGVAEYYGFCEEKAQHSCRKSTSSKAFDKCIWSGPGPDCGVSQSGNSMCCDHPVVQGVVDKSLCTCSGVRLEGNSLSSGRNRECADCMCLAEMSGEPSVCMQLMHCVLRFDAHDKNPSNPELALCEAAVGSSPGNPNSWRFSSGRCRCDLSQGRGDDRGVNGSGVRGFNQTYCNCLDENLSRAQKEILRACKEAREAINCNSVPWDHYAVGSTKSACPCAQSRVKAFRTCGDHVFCDCV